MGQLNKIHVVAAIIEKDEKILIAKRKKGDFKDLWEFPGGKVEQSESNEEALRREIKEELGISILVQNYLMTATYAYSTFELHMDCYICQPLDDSITLNDHSDFMWISPFNTSDISWIPADIQVIQAYTQRLAHES